MKRYRVALYVEVECPGTDAEDAASRAAGTIGEKADGIPARENSWSGKSLEGEEGKIRLYNAEPLERAFRMGLLSVAPKQADHEEL